MTAWAGVMVFTGSNSVGGDTVFTGSDSVGWCHSFYWF